MEGGPAFVLDEPAGFGQVGDNRSVRAKTLLPGLGTAVLAMSPCQEGRSWIFDASRTERPWSGGSCCQLTGTVTVSETTPSSRSVRVAAVNETSTMWGVHCSFGQVGVGGSGAGEAVVTLNSN